MIRVDFTQKLHYENISGFLVRRDGLLAWRCPDCKAEGRSEYVLKNCPGCKKTRGR